MSFAMSLATGWTSQNTLFTDSTFAFRTMSRDVVWTKSIVATFTLYTVVFTMPDFANGAFINMLLA
jgi:hypothetical protein